MDNLAHIWYSKPYKFLLMKGMGNDYGPDYLLFHRPPAAEAALRFQ